MIVESSLLVGLGLLATLFKAPSSVKRWIINHPMLMYAIIFIALLMIHWGSFFGVMAATGGALMCSVVLGAARWLPGLTGGLARNTPSIPA